MTPMNIQIAIYGREQHISFTWFGTTVRAARYERADGQFCPWLVVAGREVFNFPAQKRGIFISRLFRKAIA